MLAWLEGGDSGGGLSPSGSSKNGNVLWNSPTSTGAATNPKVPGSPGVVSTEAHAAQCALPAYSVGKSVTHCGIAATRIANNGG